MKLHKKIMITGLTVLMASGGMIVSTTSLAGGRHGHNGGGHHHRPAPQPQYHHHDRRGRNNAFAGGLLVGAVFGALADSASHQQPVYYPRHRYYNNCQQVVKVSRECGYNRWGARQCYRVRKIRNFC
jgi:hypothetical protein